MTGLYAEPVVLVSFFMLFLLGPMAAMFAADLVRDGRRCAQILLPPNADEMTRFAAEELRSYVAKISGAELPIVEAPSGSAPMTVCLGEACSGVAPGLPPERRYPEDDQFALETVGDRLCIAGCSPRATLFAVYAFLEELGCRWLAPAFAHYRGHHEMIPHTATLTFGELDIVEKPDFEYRGGYVELFYSNSPVRDIAAIGDWMAKVRKNYWCFNHNLLFDFRETGAWLVERYREGLKEEVFSVVRKRGLTLSAGGHGFSTFLPPKEYFDEHPEWFALIDGKRQNETLNAQFCVSNESALNVYVDNVLEFMDANPEIKVFVAMPNDGWGWCECDSCRDIGAPGDQYLKVVQAISERMERELPDRLVKMIAYLDTTAPPAGLKLRPNTLVWFCHFNRDWRYELDTDKSEKNAGFFKMCQEWLATGARVMSESHYSKYYFRSLPAVKPHLMASDFPRIREVGVPDIMKCFMEPLDWASFELTHYAHARLAWDVNLDPDELVRDYCRHRYERAAAPMREFFTHLEQGMNQYQMPGTHPTDVNALKSAQAHFEKAMSALTKARDLAKNDVVRLHLTRNALMLEYAVRENTVNLLAARKEYGKALAMLDEEVKFIKQHLDDGLFVPAEHYMFEKLDKWRDELERKARADFAGT